MLEFIVIPARRQPTSLVSVSSETREWGVLVESANLMKWLDRELKLRETNS